MAFSSFYDQIAANKRNSAILIFFVLIALFASLYALSVLILQAGEFGFVISIVFALAYVALTYFLSSSLILSLSGAVEADKNQYPYLINAVEGLSIAAGIPMPKVYVIHDPALNAFAVGMSPNKASVAFTTGLLSSLNRAELEGVAAHELSHIKNYDSRLATIAVAMVGLVALISDLTMRSMFYGRRSGGRGGGNGGAAALIGLVILILAPIAAQLVKLALSRQREYLADASGAHLTRYPDGLAGALEKIKKQGSQVQSASDATASLYFANPMSFSGLFSTHPPIDERIKKLKEM